MEAMNPPTQGREEPAMRGAPRRAGDENLLEGDRESPVRHGAVIR